MRNIWATKGACVKRAAKMPPYLRKARTSRRNGSILLNLLSLLR